MGEGTRTGGQLMDRAPELVYFREFGSGPALLLIHGLMATGEMFDPVIDEFASRHRVIVPDLRGHGRSRGLPPPYTVSQLSADLVEVLDYLAIESTAILGYSQGGAIAQQLALDFPKRCRQLVLGCTYAYNMATLREQIEGHVAPFLVRVLGPRLMARIGVAVSGKELRSNRAFMRLARIMGEQDRPLMVEAWKQTMAFDSRARLDEIECPTLIIAGSQDQAVPMHHARMLHDGIRGSRLEVVDGANHTLLWTHTDEFLRLTEEFLALEVAQVPETSPLSVAR